MWRVHVECASWTNTCEEGIDPMLGPKHTSCSGESGVEWRFAEGLHRWARRTSCTLQ